MKQLNQTVYATLKWGILLAALLNVLAFTGCNRKPQGAGQPHVRQVSTITIAPQKVILTTELPGRTSVYGIAEIRPQVSGMIQKRLFTEGSDVQAGQVLYQIDPALFQAALDIAQANYVAAQRSSDRARAALKASLADINRLQANLDLARSNRNRYEDSYKDKIVSAIKRDQTVTQFKVSESSLQSAQARVESNQGAVAEAEAAVQRSAAAIETARINLGYCQVKAPIAGRIGRSNVTEGAIVTAYQPIPLATIQQLDPIYADIPQSTTELLRLRQSGLEPQHQGMNKVTLMLEDDTQYPLEGTLQFSDVTVDQTTGSVILRVVFPNPDHILLPGMFVRAVLIEGVRENAMLIPQQGVLRDHKGNPFAMVVGPDNKVQIRPLTLDRAIADKWLVLSGLTTTDQVIVEGTQMLRPGMVVNATPYKPKQPGQGPSANPKAQPSDHKKEGA